MKKKQTTSIIMIIILIVVLLCVGGFFVSTYLLGDPNSPFADFGQNDATDLITEESGQNVQNGEIADEATQNASSDSDSANVITKEIKVEDRPLLLINKDNKLPANYLPYLEETVAESGVYLEAAAAKAFMRMYADAFAQGFTLTPVAGYQSFERQSLLFDNKVSAFIEQGYSASDARALASMEVFPAGCSEHNAGLAVDIIVADASFADTAEYGWLVNYAADYGFIQRYTADKELVTGMKAAPWHWRYVGSADVAYAIIESGLSLEEWLITEYESWLEKADNDAAAEDADIPDAEDAEDEYYDDDEYPEDEYYEEEYIEDEIYEDEETDE